MLKIKDKRQKETTLALKLLLRKTKKRAVRRTLVIMGSKTKWKKKKKKQQQLRNHKVTRQTHKTSSFPNTLIKNIMLATTCEACPFIVVIYMSPSPSKKKNLNMKWVCGSSSPQMSHFNPLGLRVKDFEVESVGAESEIRAPVCILCTHMLYE